MSIKIFRGGILTEFKDQTEINENKLSELFSLGLLNFFWVLNGKFI